MRAIKNKRIQVYLRLPNGFLVIGTSPNRAWVLLGGQLGNKPGARQIHTQQ